jgi:hypothetical protein
MLSGIIAYQVLQQENPTTIEKVKAVLDKHPWYTNQRQARLQDVPVAERDQELFMQAARWADGIRTGTRLKIDRLGITLTYRSDPRGNRRTYKSESPSP